MTHCSMSYLPEPHLQDVLAIGNPAPVVLQRQASASFHTNNSVSSQAITITSITTKPASASVTETCSPARAHRKNSVQQNDLRHPAPRNSPHTRMYVSLFCPLHASNAFSASSFTWEHTHAA